MIYSYNWISFGSAHEQTTDTFYNMEELQNYAKCKARQQKNASCMIYLRLVEEMDTGWKDTWETCKIDNNILKLECC